MAVEFTPQAPGTETASVVFTDNASPSTQQVSLSGTATAAASLQASPAALKEQAQCTNLEDAFIALTGHAIREEEANAVDRMRPFGRAWRGGGRR